eukprot:PhM_4_TR8350/c1_g1_i1/m.69581
MSMNPSEPMLDSRVATTNIESPTTGSFCVESISTSQSYVACNSEYKYCVLTLHAVMDRWSLFLGQYLPPKRDAPNLVIAALEHDILCTSAKILERRVPASFFTGSKSVKRGIFCLRVQKAQHTKSNKSKKTCMPPHS